MDLTCGRDTFSGCLALLLSSRRIGRRLLLVLYVGGSIYLSSCLVRRIGTAALALLVLVGQWSGGRSCCRCGTIGVVGIDVVIGSPPLEVAAFVGVVGVSLVVPAPIAPALHEFRDTSKVNVPVTVIGTIGVVIASVVPPRTVGTTTTASTCSSIVTSSAAAIIGWVLSWSWSGGWSRCGGWRWPNCGD